LVYCIVPRELAAKLHEVLRDYYCGDPEVEVVVEARGRERRTAGERRVCPRQSEAAERRRIRNVEGRRVADRRSPAIELTDTPLTLPRRARPHAARLRFVERLVPATEQAEDIDTARLVIAIQGGEEAGFSELYLRYFDRVYSYLRLLMRDRHEAEDLTQQVFVNVLEALPRYERRDVPFRAWLFTIVWRMARDHLKRSARVDVSEPSELARRLEGPDETRIDEGVLRWIADRDLLMFVERLPPSQQRILAMRYMLDLSTQEIATILGVSKDAVRQQQSRALTVLRSRLSVIGRTPRRFQRRAPMLAGIRRAPVLRERRFALR
jgi:RNA polymerase sigma-70 factor (ECF subfamily)